MLRSGTRVFQKTPSAPVNYESSPPPYKNLKYFIITVYFSFHSVWVLCSGSWSSFDFRVVATTIAFDGSHWCCSQLDVVNSCIESYTKPYKISIFRMLQVETKNLIPALVECCRIDACNPCKYLVGSYYDEEGGCRIMSFFIFRCTLYSPKPKK